MGDLHGGKMELVAWRAPVVAASLHAQAQAVLADRTLRMEILPRHHALLAVRGNSGTARLRVQYLLEKGLALHAAAARVRSLRWFEAPARRSKIGEALSC